MVDYTEFGTMDEDDAERENDKYLENQYGKEFIDWVETRGDSEWILEDIDLIELAQSAYQAGKKSNSE